MVVLLLILVWWVISGDDSGVAPDVTGFILLSVFVTSFLGITYGLRPVSDILVPQRIWSFVIISDAGLPLYERDFSKVEQIGDLILFASALSSVNTVIMAQLRSKTPLQLILMEDRATMIFVEDNFMFCLVADHDTLQLEIALDEIVSRIKAHPNFVKLKLNSQTNTNFIDAILDELFKSAPSASQSFPQMAMQLEPEPESAVLNFESAVPQPTTLVNFEQLNIETPETKESKEDII